MARVVNQDIPPELLFPYRAALQPAARWRDNAFGAFYFGERAFGESRDPEYIRRRYPWKLPHMRSD